MEDLVTQQNADGLAIQQFISNYRKAPLDRRTLDFFQTKIQELDSLWSKLNDRDNLIRRSHGDEVTHPYFVNDFYTALANKVNPIREEMLAKFGQLKKAQLDTKPNNDGATTSKNNPVPAAKSRNIVPGAPSSRIEDPLYERIKKQKTIIDTVSKLLRSAIEDNSNQSSRYYAVQKQTIERHWKMAQTLHEQIWESINIIDPSVYDYDAFVHLECNVHKQLTMLEDMSTEASNVSTTPTNREVRSSNINLPRIELPTFDGNLMKWTQYRDLFLELVDKQPIPLCQKMWYLKSSLTGEAAGLIQHFSATASNYASAWQVVNERFENPRLLVNAILNRLLSQPQANNDSASAIRAMHDTTQECLLNLQNLGIEIHGWDPLLLHLLVQRMHKTSHTLWETSLKDPKQLPTMDEFLKFLKTRFQSLEVLGSKVSTTPKVTNESSKRGPYNALTAAITTKQNCIACKEEHSIFKCPVFGRMAPTQRLKLIQRYNHCVNCLRSGHVARTCTSRNCTICNKRHNTFLHLNSTTNLTQGSTTNTKPMASVTGSENHVAPVSLAAVRESKSESRNVLLTTVRMYIANQRGEKVPCRAILDNGSQANFITKGLVAKLGLRASPCNVGIEGIGLLPRSTSERVNIEVSSLTTGFSKRLEAYVLPKIVANQPTKQININDWQIPNNIKLADMGFHESGPIDILIGAGTFYSLLCIGQISLGENLPTLQNSLFGWLVSGEYEDHDSTSASITCGICTEESSLNHQLEKFWQLEENEPRANTLTEVERRTDEMFIQSLRRSSDGRFVVKLPFQTEAKQLGESRGIALQRLKGIERKFLKDESFKAEYVKFMQEYERLGHMKEISPEGIRGLHYFIPHHAVIKPDSTSTKLRVVFDASAKTSTNLSLNDVLAKGPMIQDDVFTILVRFRLHRFVFTADIEKMYRQIWIDEEDQPMQLIWWREDPNKPLKCYQLTTVTYGTRSAPYLAIRTLRALADQKQHQYPLAAKAIRENFYVDDALSGSDNLVMAVEIQSQLRTMLQNAGFKLRKWCANHPQLLKNIPKEDQEATVNFNNAESEHIKTMGLIWHPLKDCFSLKVGKVQNERITKRSILSDTAQIFDPLGFIAPVTVMAKIILQQLWALKLDWDASVPQDIQSKWMQFREQLQLLNNFTIPRHLFGQRAAVKPQLHIFADASERAYGAVAYMRMTEPQNVVIIRFLCAKSRVAPVKQITLPRLELCAAKIAVDMYEKLHESDGFKNVETYFWTDSTATLGWINAESANYHTFIANRIAAIQRLTSSRQWRFVRSEDNPADMLSRGLLPSKIIDNNFWLYGPKFLHGNLSCWPLQPPRGKCELELRKPTVTTMVTTKSSDDILLSINHRNCFRRLQRIVAYMLRFNKLRRGGSKTINLEESEMENALRIIIRTMQKSHFNEDIEDLKRNRAVKNSSAISSLTPFIDEDNLLRVGGRLNAANLNFDAKHPMLLPYHHPFVKLLLDTTHREKLHAGPQTLMGLIRQRFWPLKLKMAARSTVQNCVQCSRAKPKLLQQLMGNLPADRVQPARPFVISGVDFFGPVWTHFKIRGKRPLKAYVAVFCCFSSKAIHMELVNDLTTEAFLGALKRFIARRGHCKKLYCDNATNFVGAKNYMQELQHIVQEDASNKKITNECNKRGIEFSFIPPRAPHFGGLWEAGVKSAKKLLQGILSSASLSYEEMETVIIEAEAILNSRPLTPLSSDPNDLQALTPGHLLIGEPLTSIVDPRAHQNQASYPSRWKLVTQLKAEFWKRWQHEYLSGLQHRYKWKQRCQNVKPGTMVIIKDDNLPPLKWPLGRITRIIHGEDGLVRVADVRTATGTSRRSIHRLSPLPINEPEVDEENNSDPIAEDNQSYEEVEVPVPSKRQRLHSTTTFTTVLLACLFLPLCFASPVEITPFDSNPGIYFERLGTAGIVSSEWNLITYIDLQSYWRNFDVIPGYNKALQKSCDMVSELKHCNVMLNLLTKFMNEMIMKNELLRTPRYSRFKRGALNIVGNVAHSLFGVLDTEYADEAAKTIEKIRQNEEHMIAHLKNQTSFLDSTINIMKNTQKGVEEEFDKIEKFLHRQGNKNMEVQAINELALQSTLEMLNLQRIQDSLIEILVNTHHGKISPELISPQQLQTELLNIKTNLPSHLKLPAETNDLLSLYKLMSIEGRITSTFLICKIKIPLLATDDFELLHLITVPWQSKGTFFQIHSLFSYMLVNLHRDQYYPLKEIELSSCLATGIESYLCQQKHPLYQRGAKTANCELQLLTHSPTNGSCVIESTESGQHWIQLNNPNIWIYSVDGDYIINAVCGSTVTQATVTNSGLLKIMDNCVIKQPLVTIKGYQMFQTANHKAYIPIENVNEGATNLNDGDDLATAVHYNSSTIEQLNELQRKIAELPTSLPNTLNIHDIHHYVFNCLCFIAILGVISILLWRYKKRAPRTELNQEPENDNAAITSTDEMITVYL